MLDYTLTTNDSLPLNPIEKAQVFSRLAKEFGKSQAEIAKSFNLKQQQVSEFIRLLELPKEVQDLTARAVISVRHARELLKVSDHESIKGLALEVEKKSISTRELTKLLKNEDSKPKKSQVIAKNVKETIDITDISFEKVQIKPESKDLDFARAFESIKKPSSGIVLEENRPERQQIIGVTSKGSVFLGIIDSINSIFIPKKSYFRMELWLNLNLGSKDRPERWLSKLELSLLGGFLLAACSLFIPKALGLSLLATVASVLVYLFIF
jgi:hypothetical protein